MCKKVNIKRILIIIVIIITIIFLCGAMGVYLLLYGELPDEHRDVSQYGQWDDFDGYSGLKIFPVEISTGNIQEYYFYSQDVWEAPECQIYMQARYEESDFRREIERLQNIKVVKENLEEKQVLVDNDNLISSTYICEYAWRNCYEYALVFDKINTIVYVFLQNVEKRDLEFNEIFLPINYGDESDTYCIYDFGDRLYYE